MPPKTLQQQVIETNQNDTKKSILIIPSRVITRPDELEGGEETEIAAQVSLPHDGGWGWVVCLAAFFNIFILDGVAFTFGSILKDITQDLDTSESFVAIINSIALALYFLAGPLTSALINRFGFRACVMSGSVIVCFSLLCTYFSTNYAALCMFYGAIPGFGYCLINMSSGLVVGFYFEKLRSIALAIATTGSSVGIMVMFPVNSYIVQLAGWRVLTLLHSGLFGIVFFSGMTFKPLLSLTVVKTTEDPTRTRTVTYLPNVSTSVKPEAARAKAEGLKPTATEKLFSAVSNVNFPTAAAVVDEGIPVSSTQPGPSTAAAISRLTLTAHSPLGGISHRHLKQVKSIISKSSVQDKTKRNVEVTVNVEPPKKRKCWARICHWEPHVPESRPMYRDDAFFQGQIEKLPAYQKSMMDTSPEAKTGLEYQLAVSRAVTTVDLKEHRGVCTTATRRILATMMDPSLLKKFSFLLLCASAFLVYLGFLVPYVFLQDRNKLAGIDPEHCNMFISAIGFSNAVGRIALGALACKIDPYKIFVLTILTAGIVTLLSNISFNTYYQYIYCCLFGFCMSSLGSVRSMAVVNFYGLEKLTNATGMVLLFQGLGSFISTPLASVVKNNFGYAMTFYNAGIFITLSGACLIPVKYLCNRENLKQSSDTPNTRLAADQTVKK